jgi:hypothetical protein
MVEWSYKGVRFMVIAWYFSVDLITFDFYG